MTIIASVNVIKAVREARGYSIEDLAFICGLFFGEITGVENGEDADPRRLTRIAVIRTEIETPGTYLPGLLPYSPQVGLAVPAISHSWGGYGHWRRHKSGFVFGGKADPSEVHRARRRIDQRGRGTNSARTSCRAA